MKDYLVFAIMFIFLGCGSSQRIVNQEWWDNHRETVATIDNVRYNPETGIRYSYNVDGKKYTAGKNFMVGRPFAEGTKYMVAFNPENPDEHRILFYKPVLEENEGIGYTLGRASQGLGVYYSNLDTIELEIITTGYRIQASGYYLKDNRRSMINEMGYKREDVEFKIFLVKYWKRNPLRSVMLLDTPIAPNESVRMIFENTDNTVRLKRKLKKAARKAGKDGIIFWAPRNHSKQEIRAMKKYLKENRNGYKVKEIEIVDNDNIEPLLRKYADW